MKVTITTKEQLAALILSGPGKTVFTFKQNKRMKMPERTVTVEPSIWDRPNNRNFCACGFINNKMVWCENGLSLDSAIKTVICAKTNF